jgi:hypothetical protein
MKTMKHLSSIGIKSMTNQEMNRCFTTVFFTSTEPVKSNESQHSIFERTRVQKGAKVINRERKRDSDWSHVIKTVTLNQPSTDPTVVLKTGCRQTDTQADETVSFFQWMYVLECWNVVSNRYRTTVTSENRKYQRKLKSSEQNYKSMCFLSHHVPLSRTPI